MKRFDPFADRLCRDIRNDLSGKVSISEISRISCLPVNISSGKLHVPRKTIWKNLLPVTTYFGYDNLEICDSGRISFACFSPRVEKVLEDFFPTRRWICSKTNHAVEELEVGNFLRNGRASTKVL